MPINTPDGTQVSEIILPDGSSATQVYGPDGNRVFREAAIPDSGVSRLTLDDDDTSGPTATDVWGNNDGTINGATTGVSGANQTYTTNEAYSFDGTDNYVELPNLGLGSSSSFSLSIWAKWDDKNSSHTIFGRYDGTDDILLLQYNLSADNIRAWLGHTSDEKIDTGVSPTVGVWNHYVLVFDSSDPSYSVYENATDIGAVSGSISDFATTGGPWIGARSDSSEWHAGDIDDLRVYDKPLSSTEVSNLYNTGSIDG